jgi:ATP-dependent RNA helicase DDX21
MHRRIEVLGSLRSLGSAQAAFSTQPPSGRSISSAARAAAPAALELEDEDLPGYEDNSMEEEFEEEKGRRSLASIFESDEEDVIEVDDAIQDESLLLENCGLSPETIRALNSRGIKSLFPIQKHVYVPAASGRDMIGRAKTGSGKTLAFSLPVIESLIKAHKEFAGRPPMGRAPKCIVMAPTRELAKQVEREFAGSAPSLSLGCYYGGVDIGAQIRQLKQGVDVVVGTPGRVIDLINRRVLDLSEIEFVILDEADMMLSVGFDEDVETILESVPEKRQTMLFSATMPSWVKRLTKKHLKDPVLVDLVGDSQSGKLNENIRSMAVQVEPAMRRSVLADVLTVYGAVGKSIVFTQTKRDADEVAAGIAQVLPCEALHGDMGQKQREVVLQNFRKGKFTVLAATDVAARGLDIPDVDLVVHYELPKDTESFLHRSGRTARAGKTGTTVALFTRRETQYLRKIVREVGVANLEIMGPPGPKEVMESSAKQVLRRLDNVDEDVKAFFMPAAEAVMATSDPKDAMCAALAALSGLMDVPKPRSLLTQEVGYTTVRVMSRAGRITKGGHIMTIVRNVLGEEATSEVGRFRMLTDEKAGTQGAAFDLPDELAAKMQANAEELTSRGFDLDMPKSLPLEEERPGASRFGGGMRSNFRGRTDRDARGSRGYGSDRRGGGGGSSYGRSSGGGYGRSEGRNYGGRSGGYDGGYGGGGNRGRSDSYGGSGRNGGSW